MVIREIAHTDRASIIRVQETARSLPVFAVYIDGKHAGDHRLLATATREMRHA